MKKLFTKFVLILTLLSNFTPILSYASSLEDEQEAIDILSSFLNDSSINILNTETTPEDCFVFNNGVISYYIQDSDIEAENVKCGTNVVIPNKIGGEDVIEIGAQAFATIYLDSVILPNKLEIIGTGAFRGWSRSRESGHYLTGMDFPNTLTTIYGNAFNYQKFEKLEFPESLSYIGDYAFYQNETIKTIKFPSKMEYIGKYAFEYAGIEELNVNSKYIGDEAFRDCVNLVNVTIGDYTEIIADGAFKFSKIIDSVKIGNGVKHIGSYGFYCDYEDDKEKHSIKNLILGNSIQTIGGSAFGRCGIRSLVVPESVIYIGASAFYDNNLTDITFNSKTIFTNGSSSILQNNLNLSVINLAGGIETLTNDFGNSLNPYGNVPLTIIIGSGTKYIDYLAFGGSYSKVANVILPDTLLSIGDSAFNYNIVEDTIYIPESVTNVGEKAFRNRNDLDVNCVIAGGFENKTLASNMCTNLYTGYTIKYNSNGGSPEDIRFDIQKLGDTIQLSDQGLKKIGNDFKGWTKDNDGNDDLYKLGDTIGYEDDGGLKINLYAQWKSLEEKSEENTNNNVTYINETTVTIGNEEDVNINDTASIEIVTTTNLSDDLFEDDNKEEFKEEEIQVKSSVMPEYQGGVEVYIEKTENNITERIEGTAEFSHPIAVKIPLENIVEGNVKVQVKHEGELFGFKGLTLNPENLCNNGEAINDQYNGEDVAVTDKNGNKYATIYTCSASTFVAYTEKAKPVEPQPSAGGGRVVNKITNTQVEQEHNSAELENGIEIKDSATAEENKSSVTTIGAEETVEQKVKEVEGRALTRGEVAVMTDILLEVYPQLTEGRELQDVAKACSSYADEKEFTKDEKKAITRLCKLSIMGIKAEDKTPLEEFMVKKDATNNEFNLVVNRAIENYNEKDFEAVKEALKKLENDEESVVFGTVYDVFMSIKNIFN